MRQRYLLALGLVAAILLAGCGSPGPGAEGTETPAVDEATPMETPTEEEMETPTEEEMETPTEEETTMVTPTEEESPMGTPTESPMGTPTEEESPTEEEMTPAG